MYMVTHKKHIIKYEKYKNDGWGLSEIALTKLKEIVDIIDSDVIKVVEFGSGLSTSFFVDLNEIHEKDLSITTFDNDPNFAYKGPGANLLMRNLIECGDDDYNKMFLEKQYDRSLMKDKVTALHTRQKNNFYDIQAGDLVGNYNIMVLDGPNGNGRNISYLHMKEHLKPGSYVLIDDFDHYDFVEKFKFLLLSCKT